MICIRVRGLIVFFILLATVGFCSMDSASSAEDGIPKSAREEYEENYADLSGVSTNELVSILFEYSYLSDVFAYGSGVEAFESLTGRCQIIQEIMSRTDCFDVVLNAYKEYMIPKHRIVRYSYSDAEHSISDINQMLENPILRNQIVQDGKVEAYVFVLENILFKSVSSQNKELLHQAIATKFLEKSDSEYFSASDSGLMLTSYVSSVTILTPADHVAVSVTFDSAQTSPNMAHWASILANYPGSSLLSWGYTEYNCHSYAWLKDLYPSLYQHVKLNWTQLNYFRSDSYYSHESSPSSVGRIVYWTGHSGIITNTYIANPYNHDIPEPKMTSKWNDGPIVNHYMSECPYYNSGVVPTYYYH